MKYNILLLCLFFCVGATAQQRQIDSLKAELQKKTLDTVRVNNLNNLAFYLYKTDSIATFNLTNEAYNLAQKNNYGNGKIESLLVRGGYFIFKSKGNDAIKLLAEAYDLAKKSSSQSQQARILRELGQAKFTISKFNEAIKDLEISEKIYTSLNDKKELDKVYEAFAINYSELGKYDVAANFLIRSLQIKEQLDIKDGLGSTYNNLGRQLYNSKNYTEAIKYFDKANEISKQNGDYRTIGITFVNTANIYITLENYKEGEARLLKAIENFERINFKRGLQTCYNNLGAINLRIADYQKGINYLQKALIIADENKNKQGVPLIQNNIGYGYRELKNFNESLKWHVDAENTAEKYTADVYTFTEIYKFRALLDSTMGNFQSAYLYKSKYQNLYEKFINDKNIATVNELQTKYETQQKENKILILNKSDSLKSLQLVAQQLAISKNQYQLSQQKFALATSNLQLAEDSILLFTQNQTILQNKLDAANKEEKINNLTKAGLQKELALQKQQAAIKQKNNTLIIVGISSALILLFGYGLFRKKQLEQKAILATEQAKQREQLTKAIIEAEEAERKRIAADLHDGVGQLFSAVKMNLNGLLERVEITKDADKFLAEKTMALVDESCKEVRVISHKMMPNFLLKSGIASDIRSFIEKIDENTLKINFETIGFKEQLEFNEEVILYRVIQELINNVIKHAGANELNLLLEKTNKQIQVQVADNGKGFNYQAAKAKGGLGLKNILVRIEYLKGTIDFLPNTPTGTKVQITIPIA